MDGVANERIDTLVIGGGQAGLAVGYHLSRANVPFLIVDANERTGDSWRNRWDSLKLFTPNRYNSLPGLPITGADWGFPTKDHVANYIESYADHFGLPIRRSTRVTDLSRAGDSFVATTEDGEIQADHVVVAMASYQKPKTPGFAGDLDPGITQVHVDAYENPDQLRDGDVLVVGLGNSGAEIAMELSAARQVWLSGEPTAVQPFRPEGISGRILMPFVGPVILNRVLSTKTPIGRKARKKLLHKAMPLLRVKPKDLVKAGVRRVGRVVGAVDGFPALEDGTTLEVENVVWCTGFSSGFDWIGLDVFDETGDVVHDRGVVAAEPGLYFVGLKFLYSMLSDTLFAIERDSRHVVDHLIEYRDESTPSVTSTR